MVDSPKNDYWQEIVLTDTGVVPGTFGPAQITVGADGRITSALSLPASSNTVVADIPSLPVTASNGDRAIVLDDGSGNEQEYVWNNANVDLGAPLRQWRLLATTSATTTRVDYRQDPITNTSGVFTIGAPILGTAIIKEVFVDITTAFAVGVTITIQNDGGFVYMSSAQLNPQLVGTYSIGLQGNLTDDVTNGGSGDLEAVVSAPNGAGIAAVFIQLSNV